MERVQKDDNFRQCSAPSSGRVQGAAGRRRLCGRFYVFLCFFYTFCVLLLALATPSVIFEVRIKALNAAINQLPTALLI